MRHACLRSAAALLCLLFSSLSAAAQSSPFLSDELYRQLANEISGDNAYDHLRELTQFHSPQGVDRDFHRAVEWTVAKAKDMGLQDVKFIPLPSKDVAWSAINAQAYLIETKNGKQLETKLGSYREMAVVLADNSRPIDTEAELIDVGAGMLESDYTGKDVKGKILLASGTPAEVEKLGVWKHGAIGILSYFSSRANFLDYPDQVAWSRVNPRAVDGKQPSFAFMISPRRGLQIRNMLAPKPSTALFVEAEAKPVPLRVKVKIESEILPQATQGIVEGWIHGGKIKGEHIVLTSHIQEERYSANDDRSGMANMLEIGRALTRLIAHGKLPRPDRDIRFWWVNEIDGPYTYFALNPDDRKNIFVNINQDMVGAHHTIKNSSRVQHVTRTPWSRPTFFNDVVESIVNAMYLGNNSYLSAMQANSAEPGTVYSKPLFSHLGTRDRYSIEVVPHFNNTDHMVFSDGYIGTLHGGITFTNWPDHHIHSTDDDMWQMDRTTFKRNGVAVAAMAWFMANVGAKDAGKIATVFQPAAISRIQLAVRAARLAELEGAATRTDVVSMSHQAYAKEIAAAESIRSIGTDPTVAAQVEAVVKELSTRRDREAENPGIALPPEAAKMNRVPVRASVKDYRDKQEKVKKVEGLHGVMKYEALSFADGTRTVWEIYEAVRAESLAAGEWYYGKVTPVMIEQLFNHAAEAGIVSWK